MALTETLLGMALSFVLVAVATYVSTSVFTEGSSALYSLLTAAVTSVVWFGVTYLVSGVLAVGGFWIALGPALGVVAYVLAIDVLYEGTVVRATAISLGTWAVTFLLMYGAALLGYSSLEAMGVPV